MVPRERGASGVRTAGVLWALVVSFEVSGLALSVLTPDFLRPSAAPGMMLALPFGLLALAAGTVGALVASRRPGDPLGWVLCALSLLYALRHFTTAYADYALMFRPSLPFGVYAVWISTWVGLWYLISCGILLTLVLPAGRPPSRGWWPAVSTVVCGAVLLSVGEGFRAGPLRHYVGNPLGVTGELGGVPVYRILEFCSGLGGALLLAACLLALGVLLWRLLRGKGDERVRTGWLACAAVPAMVGSAVLLLDLSVERFASALAGKVLWPQLWLADALARVFGADLAPGRLAEAKVDALTSTVVTFALVCTPLCVLPVLREPGTQALSSVLARVAGAAAGWRLRWPRVLAGSLFVGLLPFAFVYLGVYAVVLAYAAFGDGVPDEARLAGVVLFVSGWGARFFFLGATVLISWRAARGARERVVFHGVLVGLLGAAVNQTVVRILVPPVTLSELSVYLSFGVVGGAVGGLFGLASLTGELYRASRQIGEAKDPDSVAAALGEHLGGPDARAVGLWRHVPGSETAVPTAVGTGPDGGRDLVLWGYWGADGGHHNASLDGRVSGVENLLQNGSSTVLVPADLPDPLREAWERGGIRSALLVPLVAPGKAWRGLAMVSFGSRRRFTRNELRAYLTISAHVALVLENLRLVDEAREAGRQTGVLVERQRMAHEIHDTLAQGFASVIVSLSAAEMSQGAPASRGEWSRHLAEARRTARESLSEARRLVWALRPEALDRRSLPETLEVLAREWSEETGIEARATTNGAACPLRPETEIALLRAAQESLANVRKHARASGVNITLSYIGSRVVLDVLDDGVGFETSCTQTVVGAGDTGGFGLKAMRERVEHLGGTLAVESAPGEGSTIVVELPVSGGETPGP